MLLTSARYAPVDPGQSKIRQRVARRDPLGQLVLPSSQPRQQTSSLRPKTEGLEDRKNPSGLDAWKALRDVHFEDHCLIGVDRRIVDWRTPRDATLCAWQQWNFAQDVIVDFSLQQF